MTEDRTEALLARLAQVLPQRALMIGDAVDPRYQEDRRNRHSPSMSLELMRQGIEIALATTVKSL